jgi:hypothetical protein
MSGIKGKKYKHETETYLHLFEVFIPVLGQAGGLLVRHGRLPGLEEDREVHLLTSRENKVTTRIRTISLKLKLLHFCFFKMVNFDR